MVGSTVLVHRELPIAEAEQLVNGVHDVMKLVVHRLQPAFEREGISTGQFWALHVVSSLQSASLSTVARHLAVSTPTVCANVDQLEADGLVTRSRSARDRRTVVLALTPKGRKVESRIWSRIAHLVSQAAGGLPAEDVATAARVFRELHRRLEPVDPVTEEKP